MDLSIEARILAEQPALYREIREKAVGECKLPVTVGQSIIGFGKLLDFYMFWISARRGTLCFHARREFTKPRTDNLLRLDFVEENRDAILQAIDAIYSRYLQATENGAFEREAQRMARNSLAPAILAGSREKSSDGMLLWNDVTVCVLERLERESGNVEAIAVPQPEPRGRQTVALFDKIWNIIEDRLPPSISRKLSVYRDYVASDRVTLADVAARFDLSRERIRQITVRVNERLFGYFKRVLRLDDAELNGCIEQLATVLEAADYDLTSLALYDMAELGARKKRAIFNLLFGAAVSEQMMERIAPLEETLQRNRELEGDWAFYRSKICYPSDIRADISLPVAIYKREQSFELEERFYRKLQKFEPLIGIVQSPDIVYYSTSKTDHRPHFLLRLPDGTSVLVLVLPTVNMAFRYNVQRCNALHCFCREHGYGYLILDNRGNSIYDIKARKVDPELVAVLDEILETQTRIVWKHIKEIKETRPVPNEDIAAYVLQNRLSFSMEPFCIRRR